MLGNKSVFLHSEYSSSFHRILASQQNRARTSLRFSSYELSLPSLSLVGITKSFSHVLQALHFFSRLFEPVAIDFLWVCLARGSTVMFFKSSAIPSLFVFIFVFSIIQLVDNLVDKILPMLGLKPRISCVGSNPLYQLSHNHCPAQPCLPFDESLQTEGAWIRALG